MGKLTLIAAVELKQIFEVKAKFYHAEVNGEQFLMRREARISRIGTSPQNPDAVVVMINPGSCKPAVPLAGDSEWVPANPNQTQYQLMNLMERKKWDVLVILNLSDICEGNLKKFCEIEKKFTAAGVPHSIFQDEHLKERNELLSSAPHLIFAWGASPVAKRLAREFKLFADGIPAEEYSHMKAWIHPDQFFPVHPRPALIKSRIVWLEMMESLLRE